MRVTRCFTPIGARSHLSTIPLHSYSQISPRSRWRAMRARRLAAEETADAESRIYEEKEVDNLRKESEAFLARQMDEMQALQDEQRKAGMLLDDGAPVKLNVSLAPATLKGESSGKDKVTLFGQEEEEEEGLRKRKAPMPKLDLAEGGEKAKERLEKIKASVSRDKESLFKAKVRWDGLTDVSIVPDHVGCYLLMKVYSQTMIDRKLEPLVKREMVKYLGELEDDDLVMFVLEHLKDHKSPQKLVEGLEPVRVMPIVHCRPWMLIDDLCFRSWKKKPSS